WLCVSFQKCLADNPSTAIKRLIIANQRLYSRDQLRVFNIKPIVKLVDIGPRRFLPCLDNPCPACKVANSRLEILRQTHEIEAGQIFFRLFEGHFVIAPRGRNSMEVPALAIIEQRTLTRL